MSWIKSVRIADALAICDQVHRHHAHSTQQRESFKSLSAVEDLVLAAIDMFKGV